MKVTKNGAVKILRDRMAYVERKAFSRRLVGEPAGYLFEEVAAIELALIAVEGSDVARVGELTALLREVSQRLHSPAIRGPGVQKLAEKVDATLKGGE